MVNFFAKSARRISVSKVRKKDFVKGSRVSVMKGCKKFYVFLYSFPEFLFYENFMVKMLKKIKDFCFLSKYNYFLDFFIKWAWLVLGRPGQSNPHY